MSPPEMAQRARHQATRVAWRRRQVDGSRPGGRPPAVVDRAFRSVLPPGALLGVPSEARGALVAAADDLLAGRWEVLGVERNDLVAPDWFSDPVTGRRAPDRTYAFAINHRSEQTTGNVKQVWELSRHHHLTVLAAAWYLTGDDAYAERVAEHLRSWWDTNGFLSGVHWTSGIELGVRLIAWAWVRRLLDGWPGVVDLFDRNDLALQQLFWHQSYLASFWSTGSSANNHVIAEAAGQLVASCAFPWFAESAGWRTTARAVLEDALDHNTFASGVNRELATEYHAFVGALVIVAAAEAAAFGDPLSTRTLSQLTRMADAAAALVDEAGRPPRQGDGDSGRALVLDAPSVDPWMSFLALAGETIGARPWWPAAPATVAAPLVGALLGGPVDGEERPAVRPDHLGDAGITLLRTDDDRPEIWCRCDAGPHGYLSIAAHAHADALSVEVRHGGVDVLCDPGTYCYHGEPQWRQYFRSTIGHNTLELAGEDQSRAGGPFMWLSGAQGRVLDVTLDGDELSWQACHDGYRALDPPAVHRRAVTLHRTRREIAITDLVTAGGVHQLRLAFHLGPSIEARLDQATARLRWESRTGPTRAVLALPADLEWAAHCGATAPVLGWYSPRFGTKLPTTTLVGTGRTSPGVTQLVTRLSFDVHRAGS
jgi:hypothetical protein